MAEFTGQPRRDAYTTELSVKINDSTTSIAVEDAPGITLSAGEYLYGVIEPLSSNREGIKITSISGSTLTVVRGLPVVEGGVSTAAEHSGGSTVVLSDNWQIFDDIATAIASKADEDLGNVDDGFDLETSTSGVRVRDDAGDLKFTDASNAEITLSTLAAAAGADEKTKVSTGDTTQGYLEDKITAGTSITLTKLNAGGNEELEISTTEQITEHLIYTPGYLTTGSSATSNYLLWTGTTDGEFTSTIDGTSRDITGLDFSSCTDMDDVAAVIQAGIRSVTSSTETCVWDTDHFVITSVDTTSSSEVSVLSSVSGGSGTDISGVTAGDPNMDGDVGAATAAVVDYTQDSGKVGKLNIDGVYNKELCADYAAKGGILTGTAANRVVETAIGADNTVLTADSSEAGGVKWAANFNAASGTGSLGTATVVTHGLGVTPKIIMFNAGGVTGENSTGFAQGTTNSCSFNYGSDGGYSSTYCIYIRDIHNSIVGNVSAVSSTTFTITWTVGGSGKSGAFAWHAIG